MEDNTQNADFVTILSSDMIAQIVEEYFNKKVYKQQVEVVDAKATEAATVQKPETDKAAADAQATQTPPAGEQPKEGEPASSADGVKDAETKDEPKGEEPKTE